MFAPPLTVLWYTKIRTKKCPQKVPTSRGNTAKTNTRSPLGSPRTPPPAPTPYKAPRNAHRATNLAPYNHCTLQPNKCSHLVARPARNENDSHSHPPPNKWQAYRHKFLAETLPQPAPILAPYNNCSRQVSWFARHTTHAPTGRYGGVRLYVRMGLR